MKFKNIFKFAVIAASSATLLGVTSCNYLDVVPAEQPGLSDAMKNHDNAKGFLYSCYNKMTLREYCARDYRSILNASTDEFLLPEAWYAQDAAPAYAVLRNTQTTNNILYDPNFWENFYAGIGQTLLFDQQLTTVGQDNDVNQGDMKEMNEWLAESRFCRAYYHFQLLRLFGPIPITDELVDMDTDLSDYPGRTHFDGCVDWICAELDAAAAHLPATRDPQDLNRATSVICKALKGRVLLYAASDLWNGKFPSAYNSWSNTNYESVNPVTGQEYGSELVYRGEPRESRWRQALIACKEALNAAIATGEYKLFDPYYGTVDQAFDKEVTPDKIWVPDFDNLTARMQNAGIKLINTNQVGYDPEKFLPGEDEGDAFDPFEFQRAVWKLRYLNSTTFREGNTEIIWSQNTQVYGLVDSRLPRHAKLVKKANGDQWKEGWNGVAPTLYTIEHYLNADGTLPGGNITKAFNQIDNSNFYAQPTPALGKDENDNDRSSVTQICLNREPRFYAWVGFDGGDYLTGIDNGQPLVLNMRDPLAQGREIKERNYSASGFLSMKHVDPLSRWDNDGNWVTGTNSPEVIIRLAELYLNLAECQAEYAERWPGKVPAGYTLSEGCANLKEEAIANINKIRARAYVAPLTEDMLGMVETLSSNGSKKTWNLVEWVRNERFIELWDEGQRYFDVRRWVAGEEYFGYGKRRSLNALIESPKTIQIFNTPMMANSQYTFHYREYLYPIHVDQVYKNPQMVQNPGF